MPCLSECSSPSLPSTYMGNFHSFKSSIASIVWLCFLHVCVLVIIKCFLKILSHKITSLVYWSPPLLTVQAYTGSFFLHQCRWCKLFHLSINTSTAEYMFSKAAIFQKKKKTTCSSRHDCWPWVRNQGICLRLKWNILSKCPPPTFASK